MSNLTRNRIFLKIKDDVYYILHNNERPHDGSRAAGIFISLCAYMMVLVFCPVIIISEKIRRKWRR